MDEVFVGNTNIPDYSLPLPLRSGWVGLARPNLCFLLLGELKTDGDHLLDVFFYMFSRMTFSTNVKRALET